VVRLRTVGGALTAEATDKYALARDVISAAEEKIDVLVPAGDVKAALAGFNSKIREWAGDDAVNRRNIVSGSTVTVSTAGTLTLSFRGFYQEPKPDDHTLTVEMRDAGGYPDTDSVFAAKEPGESFPLGTAHLAKTAKAKGQQGDDAITVEGNVGDRKLVFMTVGESFTAVLLPRRRM
jgi:hypothetical protein